MTEKEAIEVLTDKNTSIGTLKCDDTAWRKLKPAIDTAVEALKKQIPQKPTLKTHCKDGNLPLSQIIGRCPSCNCIVAEDMIWCDDCGQSLDWEENHKD